MMWQPCNLTCAFPRRGGVEGGPRRRFVAVDVCVILLFGLLSLSSPLDAQVSNGLGDGNDGNRSGPVHLITLYDAEGLEIKATDARPRPVSMRQTCGQCHDYDRISAGYHFHVGTTNVVSGRRGEPWVLFDSNTRTQIPVSDRGWTGTHSPGALKMSSWKFLKTFGSHFPGGGIGEMPPADDDEEADPLEFLRWPISGTYEINCLTCHNADRRQDQSDAALQVARENYQWIAASSSGLATVGGSAFELDDFYDPTTDYSIKTTYDKTRFDDDNKVFLDIVRKPTDTRCYFCHSTENLAVEEDVEWTRHEDIHLTAGMSCVDCHRNGDDHMIVRGNIEFSNGDSNLESAFSCRGCHIGDETSTDPTVVKGGHLGAPIPKHEGIPPIHFEEMSCTSCHSGLFPGSTNGVVRTARTHRLGLHGKHHLNLKLPHIATPVFVRGESGKIEPHNLFWPTFWGVMRGDKVTPIAPEYVAEYAPEPLGLDSDDDTRVNDWKPLTAEQIKDVLIALEPELDFFVEAIEETEALESPDGGPENEGEGADGGESDSDSETESQSTSDDATGAAAVSGDAAAEETKPEPVYIAGGKLHRLVDEALVSSEHPVADYYSWPIGHDVRPAAQSLGANGRCADCHDPEAPFLFGSVGIDSPFVSEEGTAFVETREQVEFGALDREYNRAFAFSFLFRPWMKVVVIFSCVVLGLVLLAYSVMGIGSVCAAAVDRQTRRGGSTDQS